jgi:hypothetical protein
LAALLASPAALTNAGPIPVEVSPTTHQVVSPGNFWSSNAANIPAVPNPTGSGAALTNLHGYVYETNSATGTHTLSSLGRFTTHNVTLQAGTNAYTATEVLGTNGAQPGDVWESVVHYPATPGATNATGITFQDGSTSGTVIHSSASTATASTTTLTFVYDGAHWVASPKGAVLLKDLGAGVQPALTNSANATGGVPTLTGANTIAQNTSGYASATHAPPGSVVICIGDSTTCGVPFVTTPSGTQTYVGGGEAYPQWLSSLPFFSGVPVYDIGVPGTRSDGGITQFTTGNAGTEYMNGAAVGSYGTVTQSGSALYSATGTTYYFNWFGINDQSGSYTPATYIGNMTTLYNDEKAKGSNVVVTAFTSVQSDTSNYYYASTGNTVTAYNAQLRSSLGVVYDRLADLAGLFPGSGGQNYAAGLQQNDSGLYIHYTSKGYYYIALEAYRVSTGLSVGLNPASIYGGTLGYFYNANGNPTFDPSAGNLYNSTAAGDVVLNAAMRALVNGGVNVMTWSGSTIEFALPFQVNAGEIHTPSITTVNGSVSGSANFFCIDGPAGYYKKYVITLSALNGTASYTFPSAFGGTPVVDNNDAAVTSISTTGVTVTGSTTTRTIIIEGS